VRISVQVRDGEEYATGTVLLGEEEKIGRFTLFLRSVLPEAGTEGMGNDNYRFDIVGKTGEADEDQVGVSSGIRGMILAGPTCPVEREGEQCGPLPAAGVPLRVVDISGAERATTQTDPSGKFLLLLPPGIYIIERSGGSPFPSVPPTQVMVNEGEFQDVLLNGDTGIR
jgi:hypothetical protein